MQMMKPSSIQDASALISIIDDALELVAAPEDEDAAADEAKSSKKTKKRVSFYERAKVKRSLHIVDYTPQEMVACWYTPEEYQAMHEEVRLTAKWMEQGDDCLKFNESLYCTRGLEYRTQAGADQRNRNKRQALHTVLQCQASSASSEEQLKQAYQDVVGPCRLEAYLLGLADASQQNQDHGPTASENATGEKSHTKLMPSKTDADLYHPHRLPLSSTLRAQSNRAA
jgi:hypothetical protein